MRDADGRPLCVLARREEYAENPRRDLDHPDHLAMFGDLDRLTDGAGIRRRDPEGVLRSLPEDARTPEEVAAFVAGGGLTDHGLVGSPFGPHPLLVGHEGTGHTGKLEGDGALGCFGQGEYRTMPAMADRVFYIGGADDRRGTAMHRRNRAMVNASALCIALYSGGPAFRDARTGDTEATMRYAEAAGSPRGPSTSESTQGDPRP